jgi:hypothetical protein
MSEKPVRCSCKAEARPGPRKTSSGLRKVTCPSCGLVYRTNRDTDICMSCEKLHRGSHPGPEG